jgi:hypothetical protein
VGTDHAEISVPPLLNNLFDTLLEHHHRPDIVLLRIRDSEQVEHRRITGDEEICSMDTKLMC